MTSMNFSPKSVFGRTVNVEESAGMSWPALMNIVTIARPSRSSMEST
jgi:hypothetical protein